MARSNGNRQGIISQTSPKSAVAEAYRTLRTNLGFASLDETCRSILVTSAGPGDGKSTTASNLAVVLAQAGNQVILVDCDLRKPMQHKIFGVENGRGLANCLLQNLPVEEIAHKDLVPNLTVLTSGPIPPNPAEILASEKVRTLWGSLLEHYDYVVVDSPPVLAVTDTPLLASQIQGVLLVVEAASTRTDIAKDAKEQLVRANARLLGVVLNKVKMQSQDYYYYYYYHREESSPPA
jgi:protein-tyrosine kinase